MLPKPDAAFNMIKMALMAGIKANYILMDSWFTTEPFIQKLSTLGLDVIGRIKNVKQRYLYNGKRYTLPQLAKIVLSKAYGCQYRSIVVKTGKRNITVRIVFVRNKRSVPVILLLNRDAFSLSIVKWKIEILYFKKFHQCAKKCTSLMLIYNTGI